MIAAVLYVRGDVAEDPRTVAADSITVDASSMLEERHALSAESILEAVAETLRAHVSWNSDPSCGRGLSPNEALFARGRCGNPRSKYYIEAEELAIAGDTATVLVHVFRRSGASGRVDYAGYTIGLKRAGDGWRAVRLVSIRET